MKIASLDFETANVFQGSVCSVGVALFEDGKLIRTMDQRIMPHSDCRYFNPEFTLIHGIRLRDVIGAPEFPAVADELFGLLQGAFVIAHNAAFDINVLRTVCELYGIRYPEIEYFCTCKAARRLWKQLENHKLNTLCISKTTTDFYLFTLIFTYECAKYTLILTFTFYDTQYREVNCFTFLHFAP